MSKYLNEYSEGIVIQSRVSELFNENDLRVSFQDYLNIAQKDKISKSDLVYYRDDSSSTEKELLIRHLQNQVSFLKMNLEIVSKSNETLIRNNTLLLNMTDRVSPKSNLQLVEQKKNHHSNTQAIKKLIRKGEVKAAIEYLIEISSNDKTIYNQVVLQDSRFSQIRREYNLGKINLNEKNIELNKIINSLIDLADSISL